MDITRYGRLSEKTFFCIIRLLGRFGMVRNTPTGCGKNLPILLRSNILLKSRRANYFCSGLFSTFSGIWEPEKCYFIDFHQFSKIFIDFHEFSSIFIDFQGFS